MSEIIEKNLESPPIRKRIHPRVDVTFPIEVKIKDTITSTISNISAEMLDLSEGGMGLISKDFLPVTSRVGYSINLSPYNISFKGEAEVVWSHQIDKQNEFCCGLRFLNADIDSLRKLAGEVNRQHIENFFKASLPSYLRENFRGSYLFEKFDQKQIMKVIDFEPPFLKIEKMVILGFDRQNILDIRGLGVGVLTTNDTRGHYNNAIHLAQCGQLMASAASIYLAILFPSTAPQVVEVGQIRLSQDGILWKPSTPTGNYFFIETHIIKKKLQLVVVNAKIFFSGLLVCEIDRLKSVLIPKESIWKAKELPVKKNDFFKKINTDQVERFFGITMPEHIKNNYENQQIYKKLNQQEIMQIIDFTPPFLKIDKIIIFNADKKHVEQTFGLGMGVVTSKDTSGHYNETIFLAFCGWLMASAVSIHLAVLFPLTTPEVIEARGVKPIEKEMWKPPSKGTIFWVETRVIEKRGQLVMMKTRISFDKIPYGVADESKSILIQK